MGPSRPRALLVALFLLACAGPTPTSAPEPPPSEPHPFVRDEPEPVVVGEGVISTGDEEFAVAFATDGRIALFSRADPKAFNAQLLYVTRFEDGRWTRPEIAPFSGTHRDIDPVFSPDGARLYFGSNRPVPGTSSTDMNVWVVERVGDGWSEPRILPAPVNTPGDEWQVSVARNGDLCVVARDRPGGKGGVDLWLHPLVDGTYQAGENLASVNSEATDGNPFLAPDQSFLLFVSKRDGHFGKEPSDLYVSFRKDGAFTAPLNVERHIGRELDAIAPLLSPDGRTFFYGARKPFGDTPRPTPFTAETFERAIRSPGNGLGDIYQVRASFLRLDELRRTALGG